MQVSLENFIACLSIVRVFGVRKRYRPLGSVVFQL